VAKGFVIYSIIFYYTVVWICNIILKWPLVLETRCFGMAKPTILRH
jgi:hypothetical protein